MKRTFIIILLIQTLTGTCLAVPRHPKLGGGSSVANSRIPRHSLVEQARDRMAAAQGRAGIEKQFGVTPLLADRGLLILVNFRDKAFLSTNTRTEMDSMMNAYHYSYNGATGSAAQYYSDQSLGQYRPHFDVVGPVTLPQNMAYYGTNGSEGDGDDVMLGDMVLHACSIASQVNGVDLSVYDQDGDGVMDFVYLIYAGKGEADGGAANTIWPASWDMESAVATGYTSLSTNADRNKYTYDGVVIGNFAYSGELDGQTGTRNGIGTPTHEFGHVLGLPDLYDTDYGANYNNARTPGSWDIMDEGSYNNDGKTPPNLSPWEKAFMGWLTPVNPGNVGDNLILYANGTEDYNVYQLNASGVYQDYKSSGLCYYIENRQPRGWDAYLPGHGMVIWKLNYSQSVWENNAPNNTAGNCRYTLVSATGKTTGIGSTKDPFPGSNRVTSWSGLTGKALTDIVESNGLITLAYMGGRPCEGYSVTFQSQCATMSADEGYDCIVDGMSFNGSFTMKPNYTMDSIVVTMGGVRLSEENVDYLADETGIIIDEVHGDVVITLYGHREGGVAACEDYSWTASSALTLGQQNLEDYSWTLSMKSSTYLGYEAARGAQFGSGKQPASLVSLVHEGEEDCTIDSVIVSATIGSKGTGKLAIYINDTQVGNLESLKTTTTNHLFKNSALLEGKVEIRCTNATRAVFLSGIRIVYVKPTPTDEEVICSSTLSVVGAKKVLLDGRLVIVRGGTTYDILGIGQ